MVPSQRPTRTLKLDWVAEEIEDDERLNGEKFDPFGSYDFTPKLEDIVERDMSDEGFAALEEELNANAKSSSTWKKYGTFLIWIFALLGTTLLTSSGQVAQFQPVQQRPDFPEFAQLPAPPADGRDVYTSNTTPVTGQTFYGMSDVWIDQKNQVGEFSVPTLPKSSSIKGISEDQNKIIDLLANGALQKDEALAVTNQTGGLLGLGNLVGTNDISKTKEIIENPFVMLDDDVKIDSNYEEYEEIDDDNEDWQDANSGVDDDKDDSDKNAPIPSPGSQINKVEIEPYEEIDGDFSDVE